LGYGYGRPELRVERSLVEELPTIETLTREEFQAKYLIAPDALTGSSLPNPLWRWNVTVFLAGDLVTVRHSPVVGRTYHVYQAWDAVVESVDDGANGGLGAIRVRHLLDESDAGAIAATDYGKKFYIREVHPESGTWLQDFNDGTVGVNLNFQMTLVSLTKA
jgi:hypothetical protein